MPNLYPRNDIVRTYYLLLQSLSSLIEIEGSQPFTIRVWIVGWCLVRLDSSCGISSSRLVLRIFLGCSSSRSAAFSAFSSSSSESFRLLPHIPHAFLFPFSDSWLLPSSTRPVCPDLPIRLRLLISLVTILS